MSAAAGLLAFLALLLLCVQVLFNLYTGSVVAAVAYDTARLVAGSAGGPGSMAAAEETGRRMLGRFGRRARFDWSASNADQVVLRISAEGPRVLLAVAGPVALDQVDRTVRIRTERFR